MSRRLVLSALAQFTAKAAGRNMPTAAGVAAMVVLTVAPAYEMAHRWVDAALWTCNPNRTLSSRGATRRSNVD
jgi:voltage-gated potassium channel